MNTVSSSPIDELRQYVGSAYQAIASMERRITALEAEIIKHDQTISEIPKYLSNPKPAKPVHTGIPEGYEVNEDERTGEFYWRKVTTPLARANYGEPSYDLARVMATYHYLRNQHEYNDERSATLNGAVATLRNGRGA